MPLRLRAPSRFRRPAALLLALGLAACGGGHDPAAPATPSAEESRQLDAAAQASDINAAFAPDDANATEPKP